MHSPANKTCMIPARELRKGSTIVDNGTRQEMLVLRVTECADGTFRVVTRHSEQRLTGSYPVRVLH